MIISFFIQSKGDSPLEVKGEWDFLAYSSLKRCSE